MRCSKDRDHKADVRGSETEEQKQMRCSKDRAYKEEIRSSETKEQKQERYKKNREHMEKIRRSNSELQRLTKFREAVKYGPIFTCTVCEQDMFINFVSIIDRELEETLKIDSSKLIKNVFAKKLLVDFKGTKKAYICGTCKIHVKNGKLPLWQQQMVSMFLPLMIHNCIYRS